MILQNFKFFGFFDAIEMGLYMVVVGYDFLLFAFFLIMRFRLTKKPYWLFYSLVFLFLAIARFFFIAYYFFVPEMLIAARAMQAGLAILKPLLISGGIQSSGKVVIGTVKGDLHDIGKNLVAMMLEGAGFEVVDLGTDVSPEKFITAIKDSNATLVGMSALLTTTMGNMKVTIAALKEAGIRDQVKVLVGGAPLTEKFAKDIGADGYAPDASRAVTLAKDLMQI